MNSNFEYYKIFYYVAKYENLTKAATVLKTSQQSRVPYTNWKMNLAAAYLRGVRPECS